jgi:hypothetical protein
VGRGELLHYRVALTNTGARPFRFAHTSCPIYIEHMLPAAAQVRAQLPAGHRDRTAPKRSVPDADLDHRQHPLGQQQPHVGTRPEDLRSTVRTGRSLGGALTAAAAAFGLRSALTWPASRDVPLDAAMISVPPRGLR